MSTTTVGLAAVFPPALPPERLPAYAQAAEAAGIEQLWVAEDCFKESGVASAAIALGATSSLHVGLGLLPVPLRNVALTGMELATLARVFPGRLTACVGHGVQPWMAQVGAKVESPLTLLREYALALRRLLDGEKVTAVGRYVTLNEVALDWPPTTPLPLYVGAGGARSLALAGEVGDGLMLPLGLDGPAVVNAVDTARLHGRPVVASQLAARGAERRPNLDEELKLYGIEPRPELGVAGDAAAVAASLRALGEAGATSVGVQPLSDEPDPEGFLAFLGREVQPLLAAP